MNADPSDNTIDDLKKNPDTGEAGGAVKERVPKLEQAVSIAQQFLQNDQTRAGRRLLVQGMFDGNAPKTQQDMANAKRGTNANINWKEHRGTVMNAHAPYYELVMEVPVCIDACLYGIGPVGQQIMREFAEAFHEMVFGWEDFDYMNQLRDLQMILHGPGTLFWEDEWNPFPQPILASDFYVDSMTKSTFSNCEIAMITCYMKVGTLWREIENEKRAKAMKWNVEAVREAIMNASTSETLATLGKQWDRWEQMFKNGDIWASTITKNIKVAHMLVQEMDGRITHLVFCYERDQGTPDFLYKNVGRYDNWKQCLQVFLYDIGADGTLQSIKGLGTDIYPYCALDSKIKNQVADLVCSGLGPMFQPTQGAKIEDFSMAKWGIGQMIPPGLTKLDIDVSRSIVPAIEVSREFKASMAQNNSGHAVGDLSPPTVEETAKAAVIRAMERNKMAKSQGNRQYRSLDWQYAEMWRRATKPGLQRHHLAKNPEVARIVMEFRQKLEEICERYKVPVGVVQMVRNVKATRSVGLGSPAMRIEIANAIMEKWGYLPTEQAKNNALRAFFSALTSYANVDAFAPSLDQEQPNTDEQAFATLENAALNDGDPVLVTPKQDPIVHLEVHIGSAEADGQAAMDGQIAPEQALLRIQSKMTHSWRHMALIEGNPVRKAEHRAFSERLAALGKFADQLQQNIEESQPEPVQQPDPDLVKVQGQLALKKEAQDVKHVFKAQDQQFKQGQAAQKQMFDEQLAARKAASETAIDAAEAVAKIQLANVTKTVTNGSTP